MTNDNHDFAEAVEIVSAIMKIAGDPNVREKLRKLQAAAKNAMKMQADNGRNKDKEPKKGTCPTCRRTYTIKGNGALRRHGKDKCYTDDQLPAEIIPAILSIAQMGEESTREVSDGRTQGDSGN